MIDKNHGLELDEAVESVVRQGMMSSLSLDNLAIRGRPTRLASQQFGRILQSLDRIEHDLTAHAYLIHHLFVEAGRAAYHEKDYTTAEMAWTEAMRLYNTDCDNRLALGTLRMCMGEPKTAEHALYGAALAAQGHFDSTLAFARELEKQGREPNGILLAAEDLRERAANIWQALGEARIQQGKYDGAKKAYERALALEPRDDVSERLALAYRASLEQKFLS